MITQIKNTLPDTSRVWIYQSTRKFTAGEASTIRQRIKEFVTQWTSHKNGVTGDGDLLYDLFIVLMADESQTGVSGCSVDSSVHFVQSLAHEYKTNFFDRWNIAYKKGEEVFPCQKNEFEKLVDTGEITDETIIFNNLLNTKTDFENKWQLPYHQSWHKNVRSAHTSFNSVL